MITIDSTEYAKNALKVTSCFVVLLLILKALQPLLRTTKTSEISSNLVDQAVRWHMASQQDKHAVFSMQHANYAMAYLNSARHLSTDQILEQISGINIHELYNAIDMQQRHMMREIGRQCPKLKLKGSNINSSGWLS